MSMSKNEILINIMYTGDFANKNIVHEIINLYKTDNGKNYIYISPYGYINHLHDNKIKTILFARKAGKNRIEIIAKVDNPTQLIFGMTNFKNDKKLLKKYPKEYFDFRNKYNIWEKECRKILKNTKTEVKIENLIENFEKYCQNENLKLFYDKSFKSYYSQFKEKIKKHLEQIKYIYEHNITYNKVPLCDIFVNNSYDEECIYFGFEANEIKKPKYPIYFEYDNKNTNNKTVFYGKFELQESKEKIYNFHNVKLNNQSCSYYINKDKLENFEDFEYEISNEFYETEKITTLEKSKYKERKRLLINIMGKQNDELAYSNMLAYFLQDKTVFKIFAKEVFNIDIQNLKKLEIKREYKNIDLLFITDQDVFVVENKIKSGINGDRHDPYSGEYSNQLIKYYNTVEEDFYKLKKHYYIFKPDYNSISIKKLKELKKDIQYKTIINTYKIINYSAIYQTLKNINSNDLLFKQFVEALEIHTNSNDNPIEIEMEYKFREAIEKVQPNNSLS